MKSFSFSESERLWLRVTMRGLLYPLVTIVTSDNKFGYLCLLHHYPLSEDVCATSMNQNKNLYCKTLGIWL